MIFIIKVVLLIGLVKLLLQTERPDWCTGLYCLIIFLLFMGFGVPFTAAATATLLSGLFAFAYFWLLDRFRETTIFWIVLISGPLIGII